MSTKPYGKLHIEQMSLTTFNSNKKYDLMVEFDELEVIHRVLVRHRDIAHMLNARDLDKLTQAILERPVGRTDDQRYDSWRDDQLD
jgi:hypothetical protein